MFLGQDIIWDLVVVFVNSIIKLINKRRNLASLEGAEIELYAQQILVIFQEYTKVFSNNCRLLQVDYYQFLYNMGVTFKMEISLSLALSLFLLSTVNIYLFLLLSLS